MHCSNGTLEFKIASKAARAIVTGMLMWMACCSACSTTSRFREGTLTEARVDLKRVASRTYAALKAGQYVSGITVVKGTCRRFRRFRICSSIASSAVRTSSRESQHVVSVPFSDEKCTLGVPHGTDRCSVEGTRCGRLVP